MATVTITIPQNFMVSVNQFMGTVRRMQNLTNQFLQSVQQVQPPQVQTQAQVVTSHFQRMLQILRRAGATFQRFIDTIVNSMGTVGRTFMKILTPVYMATTAFVGFAVSAATFTFRIATGAISGISWLMKWIFDKMVGLGDSMLADFLAASGTYATIGGLKAYRTAFGGLPNDPGMTARMAQVRGSMVSRQYIALQLLGVKNFKDTADTMMEVTLAAARFMKSQTAGQELLMADAFALTSLFSPERLIALRNIDIEELEYAKRMYLQYKPLMQISDRARIEWLRFTIEIRAFWVKIETVIAENLASSGFLGTLQRLSQSIVHFIEVFMRSPLTEKIVRNLGQYIDQFSRWMSDPKHIEKMEAMLQDIKGIIKAVTQALGHLIRLWRLFAPAQIARYPGRAAFLRRIGMLQPPGRLPIGPEVPTYAPPTIGPGRARFAKRIGVARPAGAEPIAGRRGGARGEPSTADIRTPTPGGTLRGGWVNSSDLYITLRNKFKNSSLNGYVPRDGARWGIRTGSPDEWARLGVAVAKQESNLNANSGGGGLFQFEANDLARYGVSGSVNDPNAQVDAMVNQWTRAIKTDGVVSAPGTGPKGGWGGAGRYFGSMRYGPTWKGGGADVDKYLSGGGWADRAQGVARGQPITAPTTGRPEGMFGGGEGGRLRGTAAGVDNRLVDAVRKGTWALPPGWHAEITSGVRGGTPSSQHFYGHAMDVQIYDERGNAIPNRGDDSTGAYTKLARATYGVILQDHPELKGKFAWGGAFGTQLGGSGPPDLMHFDIGGERGHWEERRPSAMGPLYRESVPPGGTPPAVVPSTVHPGAPIAPGAVTAVGGAAPQAFIMHHTGGGRTVGDIQNTLRQRGLGVEYIMDREGNIYQTGGPGAANIMPGWGAGAGLNNKNIVGMEVIARNDADVTPAQVEAAKRFIEKNYPNTPVFGHGEVNPGHKEADEGMTIVSAIRKDRSTRSARPDIPGGAWQADTYAQVPSWERPEAVLPEPDIPEKKPVSSWQDPNLPGDHPHKPLIFRKPKMDVEPDEEEEERGVEHHNVSTGRDKHENPVHTIKVDNRSDLDVTPAKNHSDSDASAEMHGSPL